MRRTIGGVGVLTLLLTGFTLGCHKPMVQHKPPPDPLLISKKPIEGKPEVGEPVRAARLDPLPPPLPRRDTPPASDMTATVQPRAVNLAADKSGE